MLAASGLVMFISAPGQTYVVSIFVEPMINELGWSRTLFSGLYTGGSLTAALAVPFVGRMLDKFGGRVVLVVVAVLFGFATLLISRVETPAHLFAGFVAIRALGQGSLSLIATTLAAMWFLRMRGRAMAFMSLASPASQAAFPLLVFFLIAAVGWRNSWIVLSGIIWITLIPAGILLVRRSPEAVGMLPDGERRPMQDASAQSVTPGDGDWTLAEAIRTRAFWLLLFVGMSLSMIGTALAFHHISLFVSKGLGIGLAAGVLSFMAPMALVGTFTAGFLSDKIPNRYVMAAGQFLFVVVMAWAIWMDAPWQAFVYGGVMGFAQGTIMTINNVIWPNYFGRTHIGSIRGVAGTAMVAFSALGPLPFGFLFDRTGDYDRAILAFIGVPIACGILILLAVAPRKQSALVTKESPTV